LSPCWTRPAHRERAGHQPRRGLALAGLERVANAARRDRGGALGDRPDGAGFDAVLRSFLGQDRDVAAAALAEGEVLARDHPARADVPREQLADERFGRGGGELGVEMEHQHRVGPAAANSSSRWSSVVSRNHGTWGAKWRTGCGSKVATIAGRLSPARPLDRLAHHRLVAEMEPVEVAQRQDRAAQGFGPHDGSSGCAQMPSSAGARGTSARESPAARCRPSPRGFRRGEARVDQRLRHLTSCEVSNRTVVAPS
jgi:hypothetical protein